MSIDYSSGMKLTPARLNAPLRRIVRKTAPETVNNSLTPQDDNELFFPVVANAIYVVEASLVYNSGTTPDIKFGFTWPTGATATWFGYGLAAGAASFAGDVAANAWQSPSSGSVIAFGGAGATDVGARLFLRLTMSTTAGNLQLQWAQNTANASDTILRAGSWFEYQRVS